MHENDCSPEVRETPAASITDEEIEEYFHTFLMAEFAKLKARFTSLNDFGIAVFTRTRCFVTSPHTVSSGLPILPEGKDVCEFWSKMLEYAATKGIDTSSHPANGKPYTFLFNIHYKK